MTWFRVGGAGIPASLKNAMNAVFNKKFGTSGQNYPPNGWPDDVNLMGPLPEGTASGSIAHISDGADQVPIKLWNSNVDASVDGVSEVNAVRTGKNLVDGTNFTRGLPSTTIGASIDTISASTRYAYFGTPIKGGNYTVSSVSNDADYFIAILIFGYTNGALSFYTNATVNASKTVDLSACDYARIAIGSRTVQITVPTDFTDYGTIQLEVGSTATAYEAYKTPTQYTVSLGRTIHGGSLEFISGAGTDENGVNFTFDPISPIPETENVCNFWTNVGSSSIVYRRDIDLALQAVSSSRGLMMASRPVTQLVGEESDPDQVNELVENDETEQEGEDDAR